MDAYVTIVMGHARVEGGDDYVAKVFPDPYAATEYIEANGGYRKYYLVVKKVTGDVAGGKEQSDAAVSQCICDLIAGLVEQPGGTYTFYAWS